LDVAVVSGASVLTVNDGLCQDALAGAHPSAKNGYKVEIAKTLVKRAILG